MQLLTIYSTSKGLTNHSLKYTIYITLTISLCTMVTHIPILVNNHSQTTSSILNSVATLTIGGVPLLWVTHIPTLVTACFSCQMLWRLYGGASPENIGSSDGPHTKTDITTLWSVSLSQRAIIGGLSGHVWGCVAIECELDPYTAAHIYTLPH